MHELPEPATRPLSGYSSAYGSAPATPTHLYDSVPPSAPPPPPVSQLELLRRVSELSLRPAPECPVPLPVPMPVGQPAPESTASQEVQLELAEEPDESLDEEQPQPVSAAEFKQVSRAHALFN